MFGMGMGELIVILIVALLFLGPDKLPDAAKALGKGVRELRKHTRGLQDHIESDEELGSTVRELKSVLRGEDPIPSIKPPDKTGVGRKPVPGPAKEKAEADAGAAIAAAKARSAAGAPAPASDADADAPAPTLTNEPKDPAANG